MAENIFNKFKTKESAKAFDYIAGKFPEPLTTPLELMTYLDKSAKEMEEAVKILEESGYVKIINHPFHRYRITVKCMDAYRDLKGVKI